MSDERMVTIEEACAMRDDAIRKARRAWAKQATPPEGYALVPIEPTDKMKQIGGEYNYAGISLTAACDYAYEVYRAMIAAAQESEK